MNSTKVKKIYQELLGSGTCYGKEQKIEQESIQEEDRTLLDVYTKCLRQEDYLYRKSVEAYELRRTECKREERWKFLEKETLFENLFLKSLKSTAHISFVEQHWQNMKGCFSLSSFSQPSKTRVLRHQCLEWMLQNALAIESSLNWRTIMYAWILFQTMKPSRRPKSTLHKRPELEIYMHAVHCFALSVKNIEKEVSDFSLLFKTLNIINLITTEEQQFFEKEFLNYEGMFLSSWFEKRRARAFEDFGLLLSHAQTALHETLFRSNDALLLQTTWNWGCRISSLFALYLWFDGHVFVDINISLLVGSAIVLSSALLFPTSWNDILLPLATCIQIPNITFLLQCTDFLWSYIQNYKKNDLKNMFKWLSKHRKECQHFLQLFQF